MHKIMSVPSFLAVRNRDTKFRVSSRIWVKEESEMADYRFQVMTETSKGLCGVLRVETTEQFGVVRNLRWSPG